MGREKQKPTSYNMNTTCVSHLVAELLLLLFCLFIYLLTPYIYTMKHTYRRFKSMSLSLLV